MQSTKETRALRRHKTWLKVKRDKYLLLMLSPIILHYLVFSYLPMYGIILGFKNFDKVTLGILGSPWVGFKYFEEFFSSIYVYRLFRNTLTINFVGLVVGFPLPIIFALALNEIKAGPFKKTIQTVSYFPNFISTVIVVALITMFCNPTNGVFTKFAQAIGYTGKNLMLEKSLFKPIYIISGMWQSFGWNSIIYLSALAAVDPAIHEAATIDGATRIQRAIHISLPGIESTVVMLLLLNIGGMFSIGAEKVMLLYSPSLYEVADVISTYVYRLGIEDAQFSYSTAVGLFNSLCNLALLSVANFVSRKVSGVSLW